MSGLLQTRDIPSIPGLLVERVAVTPDHVALRYPVDHDWADVTWRELYDEAAALAAGLRSMGVDDEDRVALLCSTRYEWIVVDLAILLAGGATTTIYPTSAADECGFVVTDSGSRLVIVEDRAQLAKLREGLAPDAVPPVVVIDADGGEGDIDTLEGLRERGLRWLEDNDLSAVIDRIGRENLATLIYTSGTTGRPKGVVLTHDNWLYAADASARIDVIREDDLHFLWLPMSHSFGKVLEVTMLNVGVVTAVDGRVERIVENLGELRPTLMAAAPRIFEKVHNVVVGSLRNEGGAKLVLFRWATAVGREVSERHQDGRPISSWLRACHAIADRLVFSKLRDRFGGRIRYFVSGAAPLSVEMATFFDAAGLPILEGYGLTESSAASFVNLPGSPRFGTVGPPLPGTEVRIAEDGEVLIRSRGVMRGYHGLPEETAATLIDGWLHTGDIGELDAQGRLQITDRKKELIKTSGGKYVAPGKIEGKIKAASPYISQAVVHGDRRKYCTALVTLDPDSITVWAEHAGVEAGMAVLAERDDVLALVQEAIDDVNSELATYETIKRFSILPADFAVETGELTPSMKVKRRVVEERYAAVLDAMYENALDRV